MYRLNVGVSRETYRLVLSKDASYDFTALDQLMPHPVYGRMHWICLVNPSEATFEGPDAGTLADRFVPIRMPRPL